MTGVQTCALPISDTEQEKIIKPHPLSEKDFMDSGRSVVEMMKKLREELVDIEELKLVKNYMLGGLLGDLDGPFQIIGRWKTYILNDLNEEYFYKTIDIVRAIQPEELKALAEKYLKTEDFYELVVY